MRGNNKITFEKTQHCEMYVLSTLQPYEHIYRIEFGPVNLKIDEVITYITLLTDTFI